MKQQIMLMAIVILLSSLLPELKAQDNCKPWISLNGYIVSNKITPENLAKSTQLTVRCQGSEENIWTIDSFRIVRMPRNGDAVTTNNTGQNFSKQALEILKNSKIDDVIFFEDIKLRDASGKEMETALILEVY